MLERFILNAYRNYKRSLERGRPDFLHGLLGDRLYFKLRCCLDILPVAKKYHSPTMGPLKSVTLVFNGEISNVGLADRLRAITSVYYWCKQRRIDFKVHFSHPFALSDYLLPNEYDWKTESGVLDYQGAAPMALLSYARFLGDEKNKELHRETLNGLPECGYERIHLYSNTFCYDEHFRACFQELFVPEKGLLAELDVLQKPLGDRFVSFSFRFTRLLGDLKDTVGTTLPDDERKRLVEKCKGSIAPVLAKTGLKMALVTSDSKAFLEAVSDLPYVYVIPGLPGHIRNQVTGEQARKLFLDMLMISRAQTAFMVRTPQMYRSGFAKHAAMIGNVPFSEIVLD